MRLISPLDLGFLLIILWLLYVVLRGARRMHTTLLRGPPNESFVFGMGSILRNSADPTAWYEKWADEYGPVYQVKSWFNSTCVVLCDPKAITHFYAKETFVYLYSKSTKRFIANLFGRGLLWSERESHRRQRKALTPAFTNAAIRQLTSVFFDSSYKVKTTWDSMFETSSANDIIIDVQLWMNRISLDSIGIAGFSHNFGSLDGKQSSVVDAFDSFNQIKPTSRVILLLTVVFPILVNLPTAQNYVLRRLRASLNKIATELLERSRVEREAKVDQRAEEKSIIGLLIKAESTGSQLPMSKEEVEAQMNVLLLAGYETTSISLTWALIELSRNPAEQTKLREELSRLSGTDPTWEQMTNGLPYLDAVVHEVLRLHPAVGATTRVASEDDIIPLSNPVVALSGETVDKIFIAKGTTVTVPIHCMNRSTTFWGEDAKSFTPARWLDDAGVEKAKDIQGHRHLLTFIDGPRTCLGKGFALAEFKAALSVLIRNYTFEFPDGPDTKIEKHQSILVRPKVAGQVGARVPLRVRRVE